MGDIPAMLRALLEERFRFSAHWVESSMQVYKSGVDAGGLKLEPHRDREIRMISRGRSQLQSQA